VKWLSDAVLAHLCKVADWPDVGGTRYDLVEKIGEGGMGVVFLARDRQLDRPVALKVLKAKPEDADARARMSHEARVVARLEHPSIVPVHDCGVLPDGRFYYAMKWVRGKRLDERIGELSTFVERLQLFQRICDAVAFAHASGVLNRDLKPQNIMVGEFGEVLVLDWGLAKCGGDADLRAVEGSPDSGGLCRSQTGHGTVLGTPGYMAPEQARGDLQLVDERSDVFALGGILYFLLAARAPVNALLSSGKEAASAPVVPPRQFDRSIPKALEAICLKALAVEKADRFASVTELSSDIGNFQAKGRVRAYREGLVEAAVRLCGKYRTAIALILAYALMRILLLIFVNP
jgi:eukaryotic-like serine/threonine-protein kinase